MLKRDFYSILASGPRLLLRDRLPIDVDRYVYWQTHGEWRLYDAPWEGISTSLTPEQTEAMRSSFLASCHDSLTLPRHRAMIVTKENQPIGWVTRYAEPRFSNVWLVGIDICEDESINRGYGTEALWMWTNYLFASSNVHRIGLDTWSYNRRMMRVAAKVGFRFEGAQRELIQWRGEWLDLSHFSLLRQEWEKITQGGE